VSASQPGGSGGGGGSGSGVAFVDLAIPPVSSGVFIQRGGSSPTVQEGFAEMLTFSEMAGSGVVAMLYVAIVAAVITRKPQKRPGLRGRYEP